MGCNTSEIATDQKEQNIQQFEQQNEQQQEQQEINQQNQQEQTQVQKHYSLEEINQLNGFFLNSTKTVGSSIYNSSAHDCNPIYSEQQINAINKYSKRKIE